MAPPNPKDDDPWRRYRDREEDREEDEEYGSKAVQELKKAAAQDKKTAIEKREDFGGEVTDANDRLHVMFKQVEPLIDQVNSLYNQYLAGVEKRPPVVRRGALDQLMNAILAMQKPTSAAQFRANSLRNMYLSYRDRWDKMMRDLESGKIRRRIPN